MKQLVNVPRTMPCNNCSGRTLLEFDRIDVGFGSGQMVHLSHVPYYQCQECDHRQMDPASQERLDEGIERFLTEVGGAEQELFVMLSWREVLRLELDDDPHDVNRLYEVEWTKD